MERGSAASASARTELFAGESPPQRVQGLRLFEALALRGARGTKGRTQSLTLLPDSEEPTLSGLRLSAACQQSTLKFRNDQIETH